MDKIEKNQELGQIFIEKYGEQFIEKLKKYGLTPVKWMECLSSGNFIPPELRGDGWQKVRRKSLLQLKEHLINRVMSITEQYSLEQLANYKHVINYIDDLMDILPDWIGCANGNVVTGNTEDELRQKLAAYPEPWFITRVN